MSTSLVTLHHVKTEARVIKLVNMTTNASVPKVSIAPTFFALYRAVKSHRATYSQSHERQNFFISTRTIFSRISFFFPSSSPRRNCFIKIAKIIEESTRLRYFHRSQEL